MNSRAAQNYSIVEYLAQSLCEMSSLDVLQSFLVQQSALLSTIGATDASISQLITFNPSNFKPFLPYHVTFQIELVYSTKNIFRTMIDLGESMYVMLLSCWKIIDSLELAPSPTMLISFNGCSFQAHGILSSFPVQLGGKTVYVEVKVGDASLDYNLLLGHSWTYAMTIFISLAFQFIFFPHEGKIMTMDQLSFSH
jgi:hypothetical protein